MEILILIAVVVAIVFAALIVYTFQSIEREKQQQKIDQWMIAQYQVWRKSTERRGYLPTRQVSLQLMNGEIGYMQHSAVLVETRSVRNSTHTGGAVRIAKGITLARGYSTSESHDEWRAISFGTLIITNQRVVFNGEMQNRTMKIKDILSVQAATTQIAISVSTRQKTMLFDGVNGLIVRDVINLVTAGGSENQSHHGTQIEDDDYPQTTEDEQTFARRQQAEDELQAVAVASRDPSYNPRRIRSRRIRDLREFQCMINRIIADNIIEPDECREIKIWLLDHKEQQSDFDEVISAIDEALADQHINEEETQRIYEHLLDCMNDLKSRC